MSKKNKKIEIEDEETKLQDEETVQEENTASEEEMSSETDNEETSEAETNEEGEAEQKDDSAEAEEWKDKYIRLYAEFENYKKRTLKEKVELILTAILPILDDFERAIADKTEDATAIKEGFDLIFKKFLKTLEGIGVNKIETEDKDFNVDYHEAIAMVPGMGDDKKGKIIDCVQTGYMLNDKVIRHAKVAVGQ